MVLFLDSGVGGLVYLETFHARAPHVDCEYLADSAFFPYGDRHPDEVRRRVVQLARARIPTKAPRSSSLLGRERGDPPGPAAVVVACNTASVVALKALRREFPETPFIGVVPAIKPAARATRNGHIAVFATNHTTTDPYTDDLVRQFARYCRVSRYGLPRVVQAAENALCGDESSVRRLIRDDVVPRFDSSIDTVVLACTHFVRHRDLFREELGPSVTVIDSLEGVVNRTLSVLHLPAASYDSSPAATPGGVPGNVSLYFTGPDDSRFRCLESRYRLEPFYTGFAVTPSPEGAPP